MRRRPTRDIHSPATGAPGVAFEQELAVFRTEADSAAQFFYAFSAIHAVASEHRDVVRLLNTAPLFWNTNLGALQTSTFIALGRVFDQNSAHNIDRLLAIAQTNPEIFSRTALAARKQGKEPRPPSWLNGYLRTCYVPTPIDFRRLRRHVKKHRKIYDNNYREIRHYFGHRKLTDRAQIDALFAQTNIRELQRLLIFLSAFHEALWQLFYNGRKPLLRPLRYSVRRMMEKPSPRGHIKSVQEQTTYEVETFLRAAALEP